MNKLSSADRGRILHLLCEGQSIRAITRLTGASKNTVAKLLADAGKACASYHDEHVRGLTSKRIQLTSDGHKAYLEAVEGAFGANIDYAILNEIYGTVPEAAKGRYSPAVCIGAKKNGLKGPPTRCTSARPMSSAAT